MTDSPFPPDRRAAAKQRCAAATPPPWTPTVDSDRGWKGEDFGRWYAPSFQEIPFNDFCGTEAEQAAFAVQARRDAEFLCAARADLPDALVELDAKESEVARLTARVVELEAELRRVAPYLATHGAGGYRLETPP